MKNSSTIFVKSWELNNGHYHFVYDPYYYEEREMLYGSFCITQSDIEEIGEEEEDFLPLLSQESEWCSFFLFIPNHFCFPPSSHHHIAALTKRSLVGVFISEKHDFL